MVCALQIPRDRSTQALLGISEVEYLVFSTASLSCGVGEEGIVG